MLPVGAWYEGAWHVRFIRMRLGVSVVRHEEVRQPVAVALLPDTTIWLPRGP